MISTRNRVLVPIDLVDSRELAYAHIRARCWRRAFAVSLLINIVLAQWWWEGNYSKGVQIVNNPAAGDYSHESKGAH